MSIKLVDSLQSMGDFPVAFANSIECADGTDLETKLSTLGTGGGAEAFVQLSQEEYDNLEDSIKLDGREFRTYDTGHIYQLGVSYGKETDITSKQDDLHKVKFTMRRNSVNEPRYCLIGSSDLTKTLLMNEPYRFDGTFGSNNNIEKSITSFTVSFKEGVGDPSRILRGFTNNAEGFKYVDLLITVDETENLAYAYVDFLQENSLASGEITKPFLDAESYMDFAESFELVDTYQGTLVCKMSDYCKVITEISDEVSDSTVWSSKKTSDEIAEVETELNKRREIRVGEIYDSNSYYRVDAIGYYARPLYFRVVSTNGGEEILSFGQSVTSERKVIGKSVNATFKYIPPTSNASNGTLFIKTNIADTSVTIFYTQIYSVASIPTLRDSTAEEYATGTDFNVQELATMDKVNANLGELCNKKIYCGEAWGTIVNGVLSVKNPIGKTGNVISTMKYVSKNKPIGCSITTQVTLSTINFYLRWHRESDGVEVYPPDGTEIAISYMIFY